MNINRALFAACILCVLGLLSQILSIFVVKSSLDQSLATAATSNVDDEPQVVVIATANFYKALYWHTAEAALYLAITVLLIFVIRELKTRSQVNPL